MMSYFYNSNWECPEESFEDYNHIAFGADPEDSFYEDIPEGMEEICDDSYFDYQQ